MGCVDWLQTATVCTKQTTGPRDGTAKSNTLILPFIFSLINLRTGKVSTACSCCRTYSHLTWTGLDWMALPRLASQVLGGFYSLAYIFQGRLVQTRYYCKFDVLK